MQIGMAVSPTEQVYLDIVASERWQKTDNSKHLPQLQRKSGSSGRSTCLHRWQMNLPSTCRVMRRKLRVSTQ